MSKTYAVLGSSGQIGSALVKYLREKGHQVIEFDILNGPREDLRVHDNKHLDEVIRKADFVFFLAFDVGGARYLKTYQHTHDFVSNNLKILDRTFDALKKHQKPFIFASSQMANMSYSSYGRLKSLGEVTTTILGGIVVKFWNVYGVEYDLEKSHVITDLIIKAGTTGEINLMTDGTEERQFLFAEDCCECLLLLAEQYQDIPRDKELHVTNFTWHTVLDVAGIIAKHFPDAKIVPGAGGDEVQKNKRNEPDPFISYWKARTTLADGIAEIVKEMKKESHVFFKKRKK